MDGIVYFKGVFNAASTTPTDKRELFCFPSETPLKMFGTELCLFQEHVVLLHVFNRDLVGHADTWWKLGIELASAGVWLVCPSFLWKRSNVQRLGRMGWCKQRESNQCIQVSGGWVSKGWGPGSSFQRGPWIKERGMGHGARSRVWHCSILGSWWSIAPSGVYSCCRSALAPWRVPCWAGAGFICPVLEAGSPEEELAFT